MLIAGNWKMNTDAMTGTALARDLRDELESASVGDVALAVCPPFVHLQHVRDVLKETPIGLGAQDVHAEDEGAYTGEVSANMLTSVGCTYVILGHSERREYFAESDADVHAKLTQARAHDLIPILCVGETLPERQDGRAKSVVKEQLDGALDGVDVGVGSELVVAYEPVWAIGTGETATPEQAQEMHAFIRDDLTERYGTGVSSGIHILYGGSMKPHNAEALLGQDDVDGGLIGGASLDAKSFLAIAEHGA